VVAVAAPPPGAVRPIVLRTADGEFAGLSGRHRSAPPRFFRDAPVEDVPIERWAPALRRHRDLGAAGANVDFATARRPVVD
jgi:hypothetical protein